MKKIIAVILSMSLCMNSAGVICRAEDVNSSKTISEIQTELPVEQLNDLKDIKSKKIVENIDLTNENNTKETKKPKKILKIALNSIISCGAIVLGLEVFRIIKDKINEAIGNKNLKNALFWIYANSPEEAHEKMTNNIKTIGMECKNGFCAFKKTAYYDFEGLNINAGIEANSPEEAQRYMIDNVNKIIMKCEDGFCWCKNYHPTVKIKHKFFSLENSYIILDYNMCD